MKIRKTEVKGIDGAMNIIWYEAQIKWLGTQKHPINRKQSHETYP